MPNDRFHRSDAAWRETASRTMATALGNGTITETDAALIRTFVEEACAVRPLSAMRRYKLTQTAVALRQFIGPYAEASTIDVYQAVDRIRAAKTQKGTPMKQNTISDYVRILKRFSVWLAENNLGSPQLQLAKLQKIRPPAYQRMTKTSGEMLTPSEITAMLNACMTSRDRALIAILWEAGIRIGELGSLTWGQIEFTSWSAVVHVKSKTEYARMIPLVSSRQYLATWKADYPGDPKTDAHVFVTRTGGPVSYYTVLDQITAIAKRAGIEKHVHPHLFRHSRVTHLLREGYSESVIKMMLWGSVNTAMLATYSHLSSADIAREVADRHGLQTDVTPRDTAADPLQCPRCLFINGPTIRYCGQCAQELSLIHI